MEVLKKMRHGLFFTLVFFEIFFLFSCAKNPAWSPLGPEDSQTSSLTKRGPGSSGSQDPNPQSILLMVKKREEAEEGVSTAIIGPQGGVLRHATHRIEVPAGALTETVELTFSMPPSDTLLFELGPHGIQFDAPVKVIFSWDHGYTSGLEEQNFTIAFWNPGSGDWDSVTTAIDTELNEASGTTTHFSRYAIRK